MPNPLTKKTYLHIREIRQDLRDKLRQEMAEHTHRSWEEDVLINDAPGEEVSLNNLLIFQADNFLQVVESENQTIVPPNDAQNE